MATQFDPIAKDESLNTTEATPRNIADVLAEGLKGIEDALPPSYTEGDGIDITNKEISVDTAFTEASTRANIASGETFSTILGKIKKWFTDIPNLFVSKTGDTMTGTLYINRQDGTTSSTGTSQLNLGNSIAEGTDKNSYGRLAIFGKRSAYSFLQATGMTANRVHELPDKSGTLAIAPKYLDNKTDIDAFIDEVVLSATLTVSSAVICNTSKNDVFTAMTNIPSGYLVLYESDSIWVNHPSFVYVDGYNHIWVGALAKSGGQWTVENYRNL